MTQFNQDGFVVIDGLTGRVLHESIRSAKTRRFVGDVSVLEPVPEIEGLFVRLGRAEAQKIRDAQRQQLYLKALDWYDQLAAIQEDPGVIPLDEWSLDALKRWASDLDLPGRSKMNKDELIAALAPYFADGDDADDDED